MLELLRALRREWASRLTRQCGLSAASSAQRPPARQCQRSRRLFRVSGLGREVLRPPEVRSEPRRPSEELQRGQSGSNTMVHTRSWTLAVFFLARPRRCPFFSARGRRRRRRRRREADAPRASLYLKGLTANPQTSGSAAEAPPCCATQGAAGRPSCLQQLLAGWAPAGDIRTLL